MIRQPVLYHGGVTTSSGVDIHSREEQIKLALLSVTPKTTDTAWKGVQQTGKRVG